MNHWPTTLAGMPSVTLTDIAKLRLDSISFFLAILLVSALGVQFLWNRLQRDFTKLPRLSYGGALAGTVLWGVLFLFVLTMISGARELLTPGAWKKVGFTYALADQAEASPKSPGAAEAKAALLSERIDKLELLRTALWAYAAGHEGNLPDRPEESGIAPDIWQQPRFPNVTYGYHPGLTIGGETASLVFENQVYDDRKQLVLDTSGDLKLVDVATHNATVMSEPQP